MVGGGKGCGGGWKTADQIGSQSDPLRQGTATPSFAFGMHPSSEDSRISTRITGRLLWALGLPLLLGSGGSLGDPSNTRCHTSALSFFLNLSASVLVLS